MASLVIDSQSWQGRLASADPTLRVHLMGMGGAGLSAIATVLLEMGVQLSGSDRAENEAVRALVEMGARFLQGQSAANIERLVAEGATPDVVLISSAIAAENPELLAASERGIPVVKRADFLPALLARRKVIAIAGTHGKTTTTAMTVLALRENGIEAGYIIGSNVAGYGSGSAGTSEWFVIEADEYDHMFLGLKPTVAVITNVEWDHPDCYPTASSFRRAFMQFADLAPRDGTVISCADDEGAETVRRFSYTRGPNWVTYGTGNNAVLRAEVVDTLDDSTTCAEIAWRGETAGILRLRVPGMHNVRNALAAAAAARCCGVRLQEAFDAIGEYRGAARRLELKGEAADVVVLDDYAHHPTEVEATLAAVRQRFPQARIWALVQPHTYSRTKLVAGRMAHAFADADEVIVTDIYAAREQNDGSIHARAIVEASDHPAIRYIGDLEEAAEYLLANLEADDVLITLGAGDGDKVGMVVLTELAQRTAIPVLEVHA